MRTHGISIVCLLLYIHCSYAQNPLENEDQIFANSVAAEKIYLQLSGTSFNTSETIWFKALVTNAVNHMPTTKSAILHVELIDPLNKRIVDRKLLKISTGIADSFFQLHSSYTEGKYIIRAYTEWNKNFGPDFITSVPVNIYKLQRSPDETNPIQDIVFTKDLATNAFSVSSVIFPMVLDSLHKGNAMLYINWKDSTDSILIKTGKKFNTAIKHAVPLNVQIINYQLKTQNKLFKKSIVLDEEHGTLQFFPEGGALVEGLESVVGFKYLDYRSKGAKVQGIIEDNNQNKVVEFESNILGMGQVSLLPEAGKTYYGVITTKNGNTFKFELPKPKTAGVVLSLGHNKSYKELRVKNKIKNSDSVFVKLYHRGKNLYFLKSRFKNGLFVYRFQNKDLPHGVVGLTVYDKNYRPVAERHFFNELKEERLHIKIGTDSKEYSIRDSVQVSITTEYNGQPISSSVSVMAVDSSYFYGTNLRRNTIVSYFLLQSDVKGTVENPSYYFDNNNHLADLDYLMLTQGWTNYKYRPKRQLKFFQAEKGLEVTGTVGGMYKVSKRKRLKNNTYSINMLMMGEPLEVYTQDIDSTGYFKFALRDSYGNGQKFVIQPSDTKNKSSSFKVNIKRRKIPEIAYKTEKIIVPVDSVIQNKIIQKMQDDIRYDPFLLPNTIVLNEVVVSDYNLTPERAQMVDQHGMPDVVIDNRELKKKEKNWTGRLYSWLLYNYPEELEIKRVGRNGQLEMASVHGADFTYVVIDGIPVDIQDYRHIGDIPLRGIKSTEIIRNAPTANKYFRDVFNCGLCSPPPFPAILAIYTYSGKGLYGAFPNRTNMLNETAPQYSPLREYYVPPYHDPSKIDWNVPDRRTLLYWKPDIITDRSGKTKTTFFNSDVTGKMVLICEGITINGKVGYSEWFYDVTRY
ncbi:hypothetical protein [Ascidiimonas aurantiaca]|uniref:hypothetical protein n=1 Tax=Ascidiimonas aurantiaca TaxID=1685432 RepID=UPI0030ED43B0